jgi:hypothetical protein
MLVVAVVAVVEAEEFSWRRLRWDGGMVFSHPGGFRHVSWKCMGLLRSGLRILSRVVVVVSSVPTILFAVVLRTQMLERVFGASYF